MLKMPLILVIFFISLSLSRQNISQDSYLPICTDQQYIQTILPYYKIEANNQLQFQLVPHIQKTFIQACLVFKIAIEEITIEIFSTFKQLFLSQSEEILKKKPIFYKDNFANLLGGAQIIMKSSQKMHSVNSILEDTNDKYMYTDESLPIELIIGLREQISIEEIVIQSEEMYSCIVKDFILEGAFALKNPEWVELGRYTALNNFEKQTFFTLNKVVRYLRFKIISSYGVWTYFTMTHLKIHGQSLFADAFQDLQNDPISKKNQQFQQLSTQLKHVEEDSEEDNLVLQLIKKVKDLEEKYLDSTQKLHVLTKNLTILSKTRKSKKNQSNEGNKMKYYLNGSDKNVSKYIEILQALQQKREKGEDLDLDWSNPFVLKCAMLMSIGLSLVVISLLVWSLRSKQILHL